MDGMGDISLRNIFGPVTIKNCIKLMSVYHLSAIFPQHKKMAGSGSSIVTNLERLKGTQLLFSNSHTGTLVFREWRMVVGSLERKKR